MLHRSVHQPFQVPPMQFHRRKKSSSTFWDLTGLSCTSHGYNKRAAFFLPQGNGRSFSGTETSGVAIGWSRKKYQFSRSSRCIGCSNNLRRARPSINPELGLATFKKDYDQNSEKERKRSDEIEPPQSLGGKQRSPLCRF
ncbi:MAG: hypothetical protein AAGL10_04220 [Pseudomonadota bacterium]